MIQTNHDTTVGLKCFAICTKSLFTTGRKTLVFRVPILISWTKGVCVCVCVQVFQWFTFENCENTLSMWNLSMFQFRGFS